LKTIKAIFDLYLHPKKKNEKFNVTGAGDLWVGVCAVCAGPINGRYY
jgi:hypothetical protein